MSVSLERRHPAPWIVIEVAQCFEEARSICEEPDVFARVDRLWSVRVECPHGKFTGESDSAVDLCVAFRRSLIRMGDAHT